MRPLLNLGLCNQQLPGRMGGVVHLQLSRLVRGQAVPLAGAAPRRMGDDVGLGPPHKESRWRALGVPDENWETRQTSLASFITPLESTWNECPKCTAVLTRLRWQPLQHLPDRPLLLQPSFRPPFESLASTQHQHKPHKLSFHWLFKAHLHQLFADIFISLAASILLFPDTAR